MSISSSSALRRPIRQFATPVLTVLRGDLTVAEALKVLRARPIEHRVIYFYVTDEENRLRGVVPTRALLLSPLETRIGDIMHAPVVSVSGDTPLEDTLELFNHHRFLALPVVDADSRLTGVVDVQVYMEELFGLAEAHHTGDLFQLIGMTTELARHRSAWTGFRLRMPWLAFNLVGGVGCAIIGSVFEPVLEHVLLLALFIPLVLTLSESISMQSVTLSLQLLHSPKVHWRLLGQRLLAEWRTGPLLGSTCAGIVGCAAWFWSAGAGAPLVIAVSVFLAMGAAATIGTILPAVLHGLRLDPKVAAGPLVLMLGDLATMGTYLGLATWWLL